jgi:photosystem II stability/assembly factor-like uncharacterized protein
MKKIILLFLAFSALINFSNAQWQQTNGPFGGVVNCIAVSGSKIFAGTRTGVFLSTDNGANWNAVNNGIENTEVLSLAINGNNIYAGTYRAGFYVSSDNGTTWTLMNNGLPTTSIYAITCTGTKIIIGTGGYGIFISSDNGVSWNAHNNGITDSDIRSLLLSGSNIFAGSFGGKIYISSDSGSIWTPVINGLSAVLALCQYDTCIYAGTQSGIYRSCNNGSLWTEVNTGFPAAHPVVKAITSIGSNIFAGTSGGIYKTTDFGANWTNLNSNLINKNIYSLIKKDTILLAGTWGSGVLSSNNLGLNWTVASNGMISSQVSSLAVNRTNIYATPYGDGVYTSTDKGNSWIPLNNQLALGISYYDIAANDSIVYVGSEQGLFKTIDNGVIWDSIYILTDKIAVHDSTLFVKAGYPADLYRSINNGVNWTHMYNGLPNSFTVEAITINGTNIYLGTNYGMFYSGNNGTNWTEINNGIALYNGYHDFIFSIAIKGDTIYAGARYGLYYTTDNGLNWIKTSLPDYSVFALAIKGSSIFACTYSYGVFLSINNGVNWLNISNGLPNNVNLFDLIVDSSNVYVDPRSLGVWKRSIAEISLSMSMATIAPNGPTTFCEGDSVILFAHTSPNYNYQWQNNGIDIAGAIDTFLVVTQSGNYSVKIEDTQGNIAISALQVITVNTVTPPSVIISVNPTGPVCAGKSVTFTATPANAFTPTYQWKQNGINIYGATNVNYMSSSYINGDVLTCVMTSSNTCALGNPATSNSITMSIIPTLQASVSIAANPSGSICTGTSVTFTAIPINGGTAPTYQWKKSGTIIYGATNSTYSSSSLINGNIITCVMTSNATPCLTGSPATSNAVTMSVGSSLAASISISRIPTGAICSGTNVTFTAVPVNGGTPSYQWKKNGITLTGQTNATYNSASLANGDAISCVMTSSLNCATGNPATSSAITMTVNPVPSTPVITSISNYLQSTAASGNQWYNGPTLIYGATGQTYTPTSTGYYSVHVTVNGCVSDTSNIIYVLITGLENLLSENNSIQIYPNPANTTIDISHTKRSEIEIINIEGQILKSISATGNNTTIDISSFAKGMYFVKVKNETGIAIKKFVKE